MRVVIAADCTMSPSEISSLIQEKLEGEVAVELHDLDDPTKVAYVAANEASDPIYLNRSLVDADLVIPITCARPRMSLDYLGAYSLFPLFSNRETRGRFYSLPSLIDFDRRSELQAWADQAAWWLGIVAGIQVIPAGGGQIASILAGQLAELEIAAQKKMNQIWSTKSGASDMVVMLLENSGGGQSWLDVARGLHSATCCTTHGGTVVLCTQIECAVGKGLNRLREPGRSLEQIANKLASDTHDDAIAAAVILQATSDNHVYLVSAIRSETVESLGMGVIENAAGLSHLISQHATCTILGSAQHRVIVPRN
jgi:nickel-dependent lactate racemase